jgi:hypothetical protein
MRSSTLALALTTSLVTGLIGYSVGRLSEGTSSIYGGNVPIKAEYLTASDSFSEVDQARKGIEALGLRYVDQANRLVFQKGKTHRATTETEGTDGMPSATTVALENAAHEFRGTGSEALITRNLLLALKRDHCPRRWVEVYLDTLYRQPLEPLVAELAREALQMARAAGRTPDLAAALRHLTLTPAPLDGRTELVELLSQHQAQAKL